MLASVCGINSWLHKCLQCECFTDFMPEREIFFNCVRLCVQDGLRVNAAVKELKSNYSFLLVIGAQSKKVTANYHCLIVTQDCRAVLQTWVSKQPCCTNE